MLLIFLDSETTGLDPEKHRLLEIAYKIYDTEKNHITLSYESIINQPAEIRAEANPKSMEINGFTEEKILSGKSEKAVAAEIINDFHRAGIGNGQAAFVCQNPSFDRAFFNQLISTEIQIEFRWPYHWLDLASMFWASCQFKKRAILSEADLTKNAIATFYSISPEKIPHRAMQGVIHLLLCYSALFELSIPELEVDARLVR